MPQNEFDKLGNINGRYYYHLKERMLMIKNVSIDSEGNMHYPGYMILDNEEHPVVNVETEQIIKFFTKGDAIIFLKEHPELAVNAVIAETTIVIPDGGLLED